MNYVLLNKVPTVRMMGWLGLKVQLIICLTNETFNYHHHGINPKSKPQQSLQGHRK